MTNQPGLPVLSKSRYVAGIQCPKRLFFRCYQPDLATPPDKAAQDRFDQGANVGKVAQLAFPGGVLVENDHRHQRDAVARTQELIADSTVPAIFEAAFTFQDVMIRVDILERLQADSWRMIEVKGTTQVKECHLPDVAIQRFVLNGCGVTLADVCLMHLNSEYIFDGQEYDLKSLFTIESVLLQTESLLAEVPEHLVDFRSMLAADTPPDIPAGEQCTDPYQCEFFALCNVKMPDDWVGNLPGLTGEKLQDLLNIGVTTIAAIPADFTLNERQCHARECVRSGLPYFGAELQQVLETLGYPRYYLDFETYAPSLPRFAGMHPFSQIPFQWSLHVQDYPDKPLRHYEFLHEDNSDPREPFITSLLAAVSDAGAIVVYNAAFEQTRLKEIADWLPAFRFDIQHLLERIWDLLPVIRSHVYHPAFCGSYSLKYVLPALIPEMPYTGMAIADGIHAGLGYDALVSQPLNPDERCQLRTDMLAYCGQDSLAMQQLISFLENCS